MSKICWKSNMMKRIFIIFTALFLILSFPKIGIACSAFCIDTNGQLIVGRNDDWNFDEGMIVVNKRNQTKTAYAYGWENTSNPARWVSKYGSITFVQYGRENAFAGMNEAGLVVHSLQLLPTRYPAVDPRPDLSSDQYVQFLLDNYQSVAEIIASDKLIRLRPSSGMHFFAVDSSGESVVIEFLYGKTVIHAREMMPIKVLTNDPYEESVDYLRQTGIRSIPNYNESSLNRFVITASKVSNYEPVSAIGAVCDAFAILDSVRQGTITIFQTVFDIKNRMIYFKSLNHFASPYYEPKLRYFKFDGFDFSPRTVSKILDLNADLTGDVTAAFKDYSTEANEDIIKKGWYKLGFKNFHLPSLWVISHYPDTFFSNNANPIVSNDNLQSGGGGFVKISEAAGNGQTETLKSLIAAKADVNERDPADETALIEAAGNRQSEALQILIAANADVNAQNRFYGYTALLYAAHNGMTHAVKLLIDAGANVNAVNLEGKTALMIAAIEGQTEVAKLLIAAGADVNVIDKDGKTALMWAFNEGSVDISELLKSSGVK